MVINQIKDLRLGDLVRVEWFDASKGEARVSKDLQSEVQFDIPVTSWGVFLGIVGHKNKHIVLLRDHFQMSETLGIYDIDFNVVPLGMLSDLAILKRAELERDVAALLQTAFLRARIRKQKGLLTNLSVNGLHYSWDWDDVHFVLLGIYPADRQHPEIRYSAEWHDPQGALTFLKADLAENVGDSGRPVILGSHCGFDTDWWHKDDWKAVYDAVEPYNVVLYLYGHSGTGLRNWAPTKKDKPLACVNTGQTENGFFVIQITGGEVRVAYRIKHWLTKKTSEGKRERTWDGTWQWKHLRQEPLLSTAATGRDDFG